MRDFMYIRKNSTIDIVQQIVAFERKFSVKLPLPYLKFMVKYNGGYTPNTMLHLKSEESVHEMRSIEDIASSLRVQPDGSVKSIAIGTDVFGNQFYMNLQGNRLGQINMIVHDEKHGVIFAAKNFYEWIEKCESEQPHQPRSVKEREQSVAMHRNGISVNDDVRTAWQNEINQQYANLMQRVSFDLDIEETRRVNAIILQRPHQFVEGMLYFDHFAFKLGVIDHLMYIEQQLPAFDIYQLLQTKGIDSEGNIRYHGPISETVLYFHSLEIPSHMAETITELDFDGGSEIYGQIDLNWDGEENTFDVVDISEAELAQFPHLAKITSAYGFHMKAVHMLEAHGVRVEDANNQADCEEPLLTIPKVELQQLRDTTPQLIIDYLAKADRMAGVKDLQQNEAILTLLLTTYANDYVNLTHPALQSAESIKELVHTLAMLDMRLCSIDEGDQHILLPVVDTLALVNAVCHVCELRNDENGILHLIRNKALLPLESEQVKEDVQKDTAETKLEEGDQKQKKHRKKGWLFLVIIVIAVIAFSGFQFWNQKSSYVIDKYNYTIITKEKQNYSKLLDATGLDMIGNHRFLFYDGSDLMMVTDQYDDGYFSRIYDMKNRTYLTDAFTYDAEVMLVNDENEVTGKWGLLVSNDETNWVLYTSMNTTGTSIKQTFGDGLYRMNEHTYELIESKSYE